MNKRTVIVCNGSLTNYVLGEITQKDLVIGVDRAAYWLITHGIVPTIAVGDFDSCSSKERDRIGKEVHDTREFDDEKDFTDTELALKIALEGSPSEICILGGSGTRMDHELATLSLLERGIRRKIPMVFKNETNEIRLISGGRTIVKKRGDLRYVSIIPYTQKIIVSLEGFKYSLSKATIVRGQTIGISNEFLANQAQVTIHGGKALLIQSKD